jgi:hypothetical protein
MIRLIPYHFTFRERVPNKVKVKLTVEQALKAQRRSRGIAVLFL